ncbi:MAG: hypothetical protein JW967_00685 [Dehalococcoidales bacterium]|nr:hypothetical protein [Dehalococcoidales bacterium]
MAPVALSNYLNTVRNNLRLDSAAESEIISELSSHIEDKLAELKEKGLSEDEAVKTCLRVMGSAKLVASQLYEAHSQGSWKQTLLAVMPHLLFAIFFALSWWPGAIWLLLVAVTLVFGVAIYGWWQNKPTWLFSWLSYSMLPVILAGLAVFYLPPGWKWAAVIIYIPLALVIIYKMAVRAIKKDWLYSTLMLLPMPITVAWFLAVGYEGKLGLEYLEYFGPSIGMSFLIIAISVGIFIRLRQRWLKIAMLLVCGLFTLSLVLYYAQGRLPLLAFIILTVVVLGLFVTPAVLEHRIKHSRR